QQVDPRLGGIDAALQGVELERPLVVADHQLAVDDVAARGEAQLGEVARERFAPARLDVGLLAVDEDDRAEAVELLLVGPVLSFGERFAVERALRLDRRCESKARPRKTLATAAVSRRPRAVPGPRADPGSERLPAG